MPNMADITVKMADGSTDITYTAITPSAGDKSAAVWRSNTAGGAVAFRPWFQMVCQNNSAGTLRRSNISASYPETATNTTTGITSVVNNIPMSFSIGLPDSTPSATTDEAVVQFTNLIVSTLVRSSLKAGIAPT